jgi:hypothetical protein
VASDVRSTATPGSRGSVLHSVRRCL